MASSSLAPGDVQSNPISLDDDDPMTEVEKTAARLRNKYMHDRKVRNRDLSAGLKERDAIDIEAELPREFIEQEAPYIDLTDDDGRYDEATTFYQYGDFPDPSPITNVTSGERELRKYTCDSGLELRKGWTVELRSSLGPRFFGAEFLKIAAIIKHQDRRVVLRGHVYTRAKNLAGILERKLNEIVLVAEVLRSTRTDWNRQAMIDIDPNEVKNVRVLRTTNAAHPEYGIEWEDYEAKGRRWVLTEGHLVCRWHYISVYKDEKTQKASKIEEWLVRRVTNAESDMSYAVKDETNINSWRGGNILGGSVTKTGRHQPSKVIDLEYVPLAPAQTLQELQDRKYSGGDIFCGAGGISRGMKDANIKIVFAVDSWDLATSTYKRNFPTVDIHPWDVHDFVTNVGVNRRVDILHLSPPCQYWSPAHTVPGQNDEPNVAALFSCGHVIEKVRPRVFTIEQTFGILFDRFKQYFATFVSGFTSQGYSVRWKIVHFAAWGLCQTRQRLIIIGAAPGEHLPDFPKDTHAPKANPKQGRKAYVSVKDVFQGVELRRDRNWHDLTTTEARALESRQKGSRKFTPWSWEQQAGTITCSGGQNNYHWSERRAYTVREYACLQGFPMNHFFNGSRAQSIKQIGNAVPPTIAKRLYDHIVQLLKIQDGAIPPASTEAKVSAARQRLEMIKIEAAADPDDNDLAVIDSRAKDGVSADQAIFIDSSSSEEEADDPIADPDYYETDKAAWSDDDETDPGEPRYPFRHLDQKPADETCKLDAERKMKAYSDIIDQSSEASSLPKFVQTTQGVDDAVSQPSTPAVQVDRVTRFECPDQHVCEVDGTCIPTTPMRQVHNVLLAGGAYPTPAESDRRADVDAPMVDHDTMTESTHTLVGDGQRWHFDPLLQRRIIVPVSQIEKLRRTSEWALNQGVFGLGVDCGQQSRETN